MKYTFRQHPELSSPSDWTTDVPKNGIPVHDGIFLVVMECRFCGEQEYYECAPSDGGMNTPECGCGRSVLNERNFRPVDRRSSMRTVAVMVDNSVSTETLLRIIHERANNDDLKGTIAVAIDLAVEKEE